MLMLGAILAGGQSRRFGSDKVVASIGAMTLLEHAIARLAPQVDKLVVCGRAWPDGTSLADRPEPGLGPLGGLNAALHYAAGHGFDAVLSVPVDVFPLPADLRLRLAGENPRTMLHQHAIGFWPARFAPLLDAHLASGQRSMRSWIAVAGATAHDDSALAMRNINRPEDLPPSSPALK
jgi:molybdopterin-guanine dinucleotide biosynthesis protein A